MKRETILVFVVHFDLVLDLATDNEYIFFATHFGYHFWCKMKCSKTLHGLSCGVCAFVSVILVADSSRFLFVVIIIVIMICQWMNGHRSQVPKTKIINHFFSSRIFVSTSLLPGRIYFIQLYLFIFYNHQRIMLEARGRMAEGNRREGRSESAYAFTIQMFGCHEVCSMCDIEIETYQEQ